MMITPFSNAAEMLELAAEHGLPVWRLVLENEKAWRTEQQVRDYVAKIWTAMRDCTVRGLHTEGILPGGLKVRRRAPRL